MKYDIGCGGHPKVGFVGVDPVLGNSFWDLTPDGPIEELRFSHAIYMLNDGRFKRRNDMKLSFIRNAVKSYLGNRMTIYELNECVYGKDDFRDYLEQLRSKVKALVTTMPTGGKIEIEQPVIGRMVVRNTGLAKELYRLLRYGTTSEIQAVKAEFFQTYNFMTCDEQILRDFLQSVGMGNLKARNGVLEGSTHPAERCIVVEGTK